MHKRCRWLMVFVCAGSFHAATAAAGPAPPVSLADAQHAYDDALRLGKAGKLQAAITSAQIALTRWESQLGSRHPKVADALQLLGDVHEFQHSHHLAEPLLQRALRIREAALGPDDLAVAESLLTLAAAHREQGRYRQAEALLRRALRIREARLGNSDGQVGDVIYQLGYLEFVQWHADRAEALYRRALQIFEQAPATNRELHAEVLAAMGGLYQHQGKWPLAEQFRERALKLREEIYGPDHPEVATALAILGQVFMDQGRYDRAIPLLERGLRIRETLAEPSRQFMIDLNRLARAYQSQGSFARAIALFERALTMAEQVNGPTHRDVAALLTNLGRAYQDMGEPDRAVPRFQRALTIWPTVGGKDRPHFVYALNDLGVIYQDQGRYAEAEALHQRALQVEIDDRGNQSATLGGPLRYLARFYQDVGQYARAESLYQRVLELQRGTVGSEHPEYIQTLSDLAGLYLAQERLAVALPLLKQVVAAIEGRLRREAIGLPEVRLASLLDLVRREAERLYSLARQPRSLPAIQRLALTAAMLHKGRSLVELGNLSQAIHRGLDVTDHARFQRLSMLRSELAQLSLTSPKAEGADDYRKRVQTLATEAEAIEAELALRSAPLRAARQLPGPDDILARVAATLPEDGALIELVAFAPQPLAPAPRAPEAKRPGEPVYLAFVLHHSGRLATVDLGPAAPIDEAIARLHIALATEAPGYLPFTQAAYRLVLAPLAPHLEDKRHLWFAPDGALAQMPLAPLHDGQRFVAEVADFTYLTSGQELLRPAAATAPAAGDVVVFADPAFPAGPAASLLPAAGDTSSAQASIAPIAAVTRALLRERAALGLGNWAPLPGARAEAALLRRILPHARLFLGPDATRPALLATVAPALLHIATHGFFLGPATLRGQPASRGRILDGDDRRDPAPPVLPADPLWRSGLVLAASSAATSPPVTSAPESALVTAAEIASMNLWGTELVVLSACETGRGEVRSGQGVYGLRRAFRIAGAETVVTSLWKVDDDLTRTLMQHYYQALTAGQGRSAAMAQAAAAVRRQHSHPYAWAPFIIVGESGPLQRIRR